MAVKVILMSATLVGAGILHAQDLPPSSRNARHLTLSFSGPSGTIDSMARSGTVVDYRNDKFGYHIRYDSSLVRAFDWGSGEGVDFRAASGRVIALRAIWPPDYDCFIPRDSTGLNNLLNTGLLPDTSAAAALLHMADDCAAGGPDADAGIGLPPTKVLHLWNTNGVRYLKFWCNYEINWNNKPVERIPVGPFYLVDLSTPDRPLFLDMKYDCSRVTPPWLESLLDSIVESIQISKG